MKRNLGDVPTEWAKHLRAGTRNGKKTAPKREYWHRLRQALKKKLRKENE